MRCFDNPRAEIIDAIRWFGERGKLFNIHFRNIKGQASLSFMETFPDDGDMDMWGVLKLLAELDYKYMVMPDHVPHLSGTSAPAAPDSPAATTRSTRPPNRTTQSPSPTASATSAPSFRSSPNNTPTASSCTEPAPG